MEGDRGHLRAQDVQAAEASEASESGSEPEHSSNIDNPGNSAAVKSDRNQQNVDDDRDPEKTLEPYRPGHPGQERGKVLAKSSNKDFTSSLFRGSNLHRRRRRGGKTPFTHKRQSFFWRFSVAATRRGEVETRRGNGATM